MDKALLISGTFAANSVEQVFLFDSVGDRLITGLYQNYELIIRNTYPRSEHPQYGSLLFLQVGWFNGTSTVWDSDSCGGLDCSLYGHYRFCNFLTVPGSSSALTRSTGYAGFDEEFEITRQTSQRPTGVCGSIRFSSPLAVGVYKQMQWDTSYFRVDYSFNPFVASFCRESGAGIYLGDRLLAPGVGNGAAFNTFRLLYTGVDVKTYPKGDASAGFGGGSYSLWGYK